MIKTKKEQAIEFINSIRTMDPKLVHDMIVNISGEELGQFFLNYSANLINKDPSGVLENCASLMLMGYLIAKKEKATTITPNLFGQQALA